MKEQVFIAPGVDKSKASVREPLDGAFCHGPIPQNKCAAALPENTVFRLLRCKRDILSGRLAASNWQQAMARARGGFRSANAGGVQ